MVTSYRECLLSAIRHNTQSQALLRYLLHSSATCIAIVNIDICSVLSLFSLANSCLQGVVPCRAKAMEQCLVVMAALSNTVTRSRLFPTLLAPSSLFVSLILYCEVKCSDGLSVQVESRFKTKDMMPEGLSLERVRHFMVR